MKLILRITSLITSLLLLTTIAIHNQLRDEFAVNEYSPQAATDIITYELNPGRLGDHLLAYIKAKLIANFEGGLPINYLAFRWSDHLALSLYEKSFPIKKYKKIKINSYKKKGKNKKTQIFRTNRLSDGDFPITAPSKPTAYICDLKTKIESFGGFNSIYEYIRSNQSFKSELLRMIAPIEPIEQLAIPADMVSVAIHIRTGGTFEKTSLQKDMSQKKVSIVERQYPTRFPPEKYYVQQLKNIADIIKKPLFVHIFTDDTNPLAIVTRFKNELSSDYSITFSCRTNENDHDLNVLYDLFNMTRFTCLIRPASSFSKIAQLLGNHQIIIYPAKASWTGNQVIVNKVTIINHYNDSPNIE